MSKIIFYHNPRSRAAMVHWMLEEAGAEYEIRLIDLKKNENRTPEFLALNPMGKVPAILVDGTPITETPAIMAWLADAYPAANLAPPVGSPERGAWYRWLFFGGSCFEPALVDKMFDRPAPRPGALGWGSYEAVLGTLEKGLHPGPYLLGESFSAADIYIGAELNWAMMFGAPGIKDNPVFTNYVDRLTARPAYRRTLPSA
ncbi:glutathione S-transferase family protein [Rhizorhapis suberifaciens]|uniref:Glutathione S-transferase n=1 Tax=Rhizorhapis suberifaciens TaxID=13656 RepID=A0A840HUQ9_9SPHN|nr:glutathione S-transferase family protein [Rhizorhapis suberifaciens]MBB4641320.1 glutathione S-transferase [Rhizorhapis suberifaciens]